MKRLKFNPSNIVGFASNNLSNFSGSAGPVSPTPSRCPAASLNSSISHEDVETIVGQVPTFLYPGEVISRVFEMVTILQKSGSSGGCTARGVCVITNFRILHASVDEGSGTQTEQTWIFPGAIIYNNLRIILIPFLMISVLGQKAMGGSRQIKIYCKDFRAIKMFVEDAELGKILYKHIAQRRFLDESLGYATCFSGVPGMVLNGWKLYNARHEYQRMGVRFKPVAPDSQYAPTNRKRKKSISSSEDRSPRSNRTNSGDVLETPKWESARSERRNSTLAQPEMAKDRQQQQKPLGASQRSFLLSSDDSCMPQIRHKPPLLKRTTSCGSIRDLQPIKPPPCLNKSREHMLERQSSWLAGSRPRPKTQDTFKPRCKSGVARNISPRSSPGSDGAVDEEAANHLTADDLPSRLSTLRRTLEHKTLQEHFILTESSPKSSSFHSLHVKPNIDQKEDIVNRTGSAPQPSVQLQRAIFDHPDDSLVPPPPSNRAPSPPRIGERSSRAAETAFGQKKSSPPGHASREFSSSPELFVDGPFAMPPPPPLPPVQEEWVLTNANPNYKYCESYPQLLPLPSSLCKEELLESFEFRSKGRIPILSWKARDRPAALLRSAQPLVGVTGEKSEADENLLRACIRLNPRYPRLQVMDLRSQMAAQANRAKGAGVEGSRYQDICDIHFMGVDNIHTVRESLSKLFGLVKKQSQDSMWYSQLEATGWMKHIRSILLASQEVVKYIVSGNSVLVHCSDGWDRTAQVSSLAQLQLDHYYRTRTGFARLVEKEWVSYGHKFGDRQGIYTGGDKNEISPVFLQFLDCVHQLLIQFPTAFEFTDEFLVRLADESYACRFGTFLFNHEKEHKRNFTRLKTISVWSELIRQDHSPYPNALYSPNRRVITASSSMRSLKFWDGFFLRWDPDVKQADLSRIITEAMKNASRALPSVSTPCKRSVKARMSMRVTNPTKRPISNIYDLKFVNEELEDEDENGPVPLQSTSSDSNPSMRVDGNAWIPDHWMNRCSSCNKKFGQLRRKHHCRACGHVFCARCSSRKIVIEDQDPSKAQRVCDRCYQELLPDLELQPMSHEGHGGVRIVHTEDDTIEIVQ